MSQALQRQLLSRTDNVRMVLLLYSSRSEKLAFITIRAARSRPLPYITTLDTYHTETEHKRSHNNQYPNFFNSPSVNSQSLLTISSFVDFVSASFFPTGAYNCPLSTCSVLSVAAHT